MREAGEDIKLFSPGKPVTGGTGAIVIPDAGAFYSCPAGLLQVTEGPVLQQCVF